MRSSKIYIPVSFLMFFILTSEAQDIIPEALKRPMEKLNKTCQMRFDISYTSLDSKGNTIQDGTYHIWKNDNDFLIKSEVFDCVKNDEEFLFINHQFESIYLIVKDELTRRAEKYIQDEFESIEQLMSSYQIPMQGDGLTKDKVTCSSIGNLKFRCEGDTKGLPVMTYQLYDEDHLKTIEIENPESGVSGIGFQSYTYSNYDSTTVVHGNLFQVEQYLEMVNGELSYILDPNYTVEIKIQ